MTLAGLAPPEWDVSIIDENLGPPDYAALARPDLVGITAFTSQANRAYEVAGVFRRLGVPVVIGGIHATMCVDEAMGRVDSVVTGEAEGVWAEVLEDVLRGSMKCRYDSGCADMANIPPARHDLPAGRYALGAIQTTRGCPLNCRFCSVTAFSGAQYRQRPIADVVREFCSIPEKRVLIVDDNLIGISPEHIARAKELFRTIARAGVRKEWIAYVTINFADDEELLALAAKSGCRCVGIGIESAAPEEALGPGGKLGLLSGRDVRAAVRRIQRHGILVVGAFMIGHDADRPGVGKRIARAACDYGLDVLNVCLMTPLPGTRLWDEMKSEGRIVLDAFPEDWQYYTLTFPVARHKHLTSDALIDEVVACDRRFYSVPRILRRTLRNTLQRCQPLRSLLVNLSFRNNLESYYREAYADFKQREPLPLDQEGNAG